MENEDIPGDLSTNARLTVGVPFASDFFGSGDIDAFRFAGTPGAFYGVRATIDGETRFLGQFRVATNQSLAGPDADATFNARALIFPATENVELVLGFDGGDVFNAFERRFDFEDPTYTIEVVERADLVQFGGAGNDVFLFGGSDGPAAVSGGAGTDTYSLANVPQGAFHRTPIFLLQDPEFGVSSLEYDFGPGLPDEERFGLIHFDSIEVFIGTQDSDVFSIVGGTDIRIEGGGGADTIAVNGAGTNRVFDGGDNATVQSDTLSYRDLDNGAGVSVSLLLGAGLSGVAAGDAIFGIEALVGTRGDDTLIGGNTDNVLNGGQGSDILTGNGGNDRIIGGGGTAFTDIAVFNFNSSEYTITPLSELPDGPLQVAHTGADGVDTLEGIETVRFADRDFFPGRTAGTDGNDWIVWDMLSWRIDGAAGTDMISFADANGAVRVAPGLTAALVDVPRGVAGRDSFVMLSNVEGVTGGRFDDTLHGRDGAERLRGLAGDDLFVGTLGDDTLMGGSGTDEITYVNSASAVSASLLRGAGWAGDASGDVIAEVEHLSGSRFDDTLTGSHDADTLFGGEGDDILMGNAGDDYLNGHTGTDRAVFGFARDQYTITQSGFRTVVDYIGPGAGDGTDTLDHVEILQFADLDVVL